MAYKTAREFIEHVRFKKINGVNCYSISQIADGLGVDWRILRRFVIEGELESKLGFKLVENPFNPGGYFPVEAVPKLYKFKDKLFSDA